MIKSIRFGPSEIIPILVACIAVVVAVAYPHSIAVVICTVLVFVSVAFLFWKVYKMPRITTPVDEEGLPQDFDWKREALMVVGAGNAGENILWRARNVEPGTRESNEYGSRFRNNQRVTWPDFNDDNINEVLYSSLTGFVLYPVTRGDTGTPEFQGWRYPPERKEESDAVKLEPGGRIYFEPHSAALGATTEAMQFMGERRQEIRGIIQRQDTFQDLLGVIHIVGAGNTGMSFFSEIDVAGCVQVDPAWRYHVILYIEGTVTEAKRPHLLAAFGKQIEELRQLMRAGEGRYLPTILTDNQGRGQTKLDHMALTLMLAGSCASNNRVVGDPYRLTTVAELYAPFVPRHREAQSLARTRNVRQWAQDLAALDPMNWGCLWSHFNPGIDPSQRENVVVLLAGDEDVCATVFEVVEEEFAERGVNAVAVCSYIPRAKSVWMAACVPLTTPEVENSVMAPVFIPLAKVRPIPDVV
ncbi:MAG: hypothetical protein AAEI08_02160 [Gammaproteobacteria bacterium]